MFEVTFLEMVLAITAIWLAVRIIVNFTTALFSYKRELQLILVYICIVVISRMVYFPLEHVDGKIAPLVFDSSKLVPLRINLVPIVHLFDIYSGWQINIIGNIAMFIPVGIIWPACFKKLDNVGKTILAGFGYTLFIELTQLPFYDRCSDVDDLILNTAGAAIGALIYFGIKNARGRGARKRKLLMERV